MRPYIEISACGERGKITFAPKVVPSTPYLYLLPLVATVPLPHLSQFKLPYMDYTRIGLGRIYFWYSFSPHPPFFSFFSEEPFSFYSDQTSYLSICLEEPNRFQVEHFSQEELKKKVLTCQLSVLCWLFVVSWVPDLSCKNLKVPFLSFLPSLPACLCSVFVPSVFVTWRALPCAWHPPSQTGGPAQAWSPPADAVQARPQVILLSSRT